MKFRDFQLPQKIEWLEEKDAYGRFSCEPFERGYGHTIGNSLRRILLASMEGAVITSVRIENADHEYAALEGIKEDVLEIVFNLKQLRFKIHTEESQQVVLEVSGEKDVRGNDFELNPNIELLNPDNHIATLNENGKLRIEANVERGRGYSPASDRVEKLTQIGDIPVDASFSPIKKVNYDVENARVGQRTDYDKLLMDIYTDGNVSAREAVAYASQILKQTINIFEVSDVEQVELGEEIVQEEDSGSEVKSLPLEALKISTRIENLLGRAGIKTIGDLIEKTEKEISKVEKIGKKSIDEIKEKLDDLNEERDLDLSLKE